MKSYFNRYLQIDLGNQSWWVFSLSEDVLACYMGGKGVAACLLAQHRSPGRAL